MAKKTINIAGMSCAACVRRVEEGIKTLAGVSDATVNLATSRATVEFDPLLVNEEAIAGKIVEMGYEPIAPAPNEPEPLQKTTLMIGGMTCAACVRRVESALGAVPGVQEAAVNFASSRATVIHDEREASLQNLKEAVEDAGYEYLGIFEGALEDPIQIARDKEVAELKRKVLVGAVLSAGCDTSRCQTTD